MRKIAALITALVPAVASAQAITDANSLSYKFTNLGNLFIEILISVAVIWIIFSAVRFIMSGGDADKRKEYQNGILWGIVGLFVILSVWGLVRILTNTFRTDTTAPVNQYPHVQYPTQVPL